MLDIRTVIKSLTPANRNFVKQAYYKLFPNASESRFKNVMSRPDELSFDAKEINRLSKLFIEVDGKYVLNPSDELFALIEEPVEANV
ncbi:MULTISPECIES: hypothetical protein [unclassified Arcicella]|uniref:hypothetical protein n=1 Tax=unclassified Arcicella TaxID=2644986 RepID=UPI0028657EFA|nr:MULTISPECIES: hypothetical protein [unclassified Arcicella]MDR6564924.1 hypothetical protein [Arcicella sp. BE51]MDR6814714.1 hypothetical protein [Arcicella sp. BE140]MDR6826160.1 hypothetical protein [Arcicella sp. BE139]